MASDNGSRVFQRLGAPLRVVRQSWGAVRETDGTVFLRVWQDQCNRVVGGKRYVRVDHPGEVTFGRTERRQHLELVRAGAPCFLIMCEAEDPTATTPRRIKSCNSKEIFCTGEIREFADGVYIEITMKRIKI